MTCEACVNAIKKSLTKTYGTELVSVNANLETQLVDIEISPASGQPYSDDQVYAALDKTGRTITRLS